MNDTLSYFVERLSELEGMIPELEDIAQNAIDTDFISCIESQLLSARNLVQTVKLYKGWE